MYKDEFEFLDAAEDSKRKYINQLGYRLGGPFILIPALPRLSIRLAYITFVGVLRESNTRIQPGNAVNVDVKNHPLMGCYIAVDPAQTSRSNLDATISYNGHTVIVSDSN